MTNEERGLERALVELGHRLALPGAPDLTRGVRAAIEGGRTEPVHRRGLVSWRAVLAAAVVVALVAGGTLVFSPAARRAVADWLGIGGVRIGHGAGPTPTAPAGSNLALGTRVTLDEARRRVDWPVGVPAAVGPPDAVYAADVPAGGSVSLVYVAGDGLPNTDETGLGMIVTEFRATLTPDFGKKIVPAEGTLEITEVDGALAFWITGPHTVYLYRDSDGDIREDTVRLAGNALVWVEDGTTYRIESALGLDEAVRIAESMQ